MTININELRQLAQAATPGPWKTGQYLGSLRQFVIHTDVGDKGRGSDVAFTSSAFGSDETVANARLISAANPAAISELLDRLEAAESDALEQARLNGMGSEREAALMAKLEAAEKERDWNAERLEDAIEELTALRAKIEAMENQEPVKIQHRVPFVNSNGELVGYSVWIDGRGFDHWPHRSLYALPGAKGEET